MENDGAAVVTVRRTGKTDCRVSIAYSTYDETASAGDDYVETKGTLKFGPGESKKQVCPERRMATNPPSLLPTAPSIPHHLRCSCRSLSQ